MLKLNEIKVGFFGTPDFALTILKRLKNESINVEYVVTQPPKKSGRGQKENFSCVHQWSIKENLKVFTPYNTNEVKFIESIKRFEVDFIIVVAFRMILRWFMTQQ